MANLYHLLIQSPEANLSRFLRHINGGGAQRYRKGTGLMSSFSKAALTLFYCWRQMLIRKKPFV